MPRYEVTVQGRGIALPLDTAVAVGFLTVVQLWARDPLDAETRAVGEVKASWDASLYAWRNRGDPPCLTIIRVGLLSWWHRLLGAPKGYIFFTADGVQLPSEPRRLAH